MTDSPAIVVGSVDAITGKAIIEFLQPIDWILVVLPVVGVLALAAYTQRYVQGVADFMAGGRVAGRYLICNARGEAGSGLANSLANIEVLMASGFVLGWWQAVSVPVMLLVAIFGFVIYRYRETRALTIGQFFEIRYSRRFRLFMGGLGFLAGILNYGIFPAVASRFFVYFLGLPEVVHLGGLAVPTYVIVILLYLGCAVAMMLMGGQITLMVTDCVEGLLSHAIYLVIIVALLAVIHWSQITHMLSASPPGKSLVNPFDALKVNDFNVWYVFMTLATAIYGTMAWQNQQGFNAAARTAHEGRMGGVLGYWRAYARQVMLVVLAICALTYLTDPAFSDKAASVNQVLDSIGNSQVRKQMQAPVALRFLLPTGIKGLFLTVMVMGVLASDAGHMHSWGSIFIQDVLLPMRKKPLTPAQHIRWLRLSIAGVATFALLFSTFFQQTEYIIMWWQITTGIFVSGAGAVIIGGLYWKKGTTAAAWSAVATSSLLCLAGIFGKHWVDGFPLNGLQTYFLAAIIAVLVYVVVSLLTCREDFAMERMLHRGQYVVEQVAGAAAQPGFRWSKLLGFDENFTRGDKLIAGGIFWWAIFWLLVVILGSVWNLLAPWPTRWWINYWLVIGVGLPFFIAVATLIWFGIGGIRDIRDFFHVLRTVKRDSRDDGRVAGHHLLADEPVVQGKSCPDSSPPIKPDK